MAFELANLKSFDDLPFDQIIDVRSPGEFALDHLPGAINLPVLDDDERALVGTVYVQDSRFKARKMGAALVARNASRHLQGALEDKDGSYRPLVYCWRGGQRSRSFASILAQIGWRVQVLEGGYRAYRRAVAQVLYEDAFPSPLVVLAGNTGTAKTEILHRLKQLGCQVIDLEGLANHRGSLFGSMPGGQPTQKAFESALAMEISRFDPARPVVVEAESSKVGQLYVPPCLWQEMQTAPRITVLASQLERAKYLTRAYRDLANNSDDLLKLLDKLRPLHSKNRIESWRELAQNSAFEDLAAELMLHHYDPRYTKQGGVTPITPEHSIALSDLSDLSLDKAAQELTQRING